MGPLRWLVAPCRRHGVRLLSSKVAAIPRFARGRLALIAVVALGAIAPAGAAMAADEDAPAADAKPAAGDDTPSTPPAPTPSLLHLHDVEIH